MAKVKAQIGPRAADVPVMELPLTVQYANLLKEQKHPEKPSVRRFREQHRDVPGFEARARVLNRVFLLDLLSS